MKLDTLTIVGVGLIGGSIGLAARRRGVARRVLGVARQQSSLDQAVAIGAIDQGMLEPAEAVQDASLVVVCTPVDVIAEQVLALAPHYPRGCLVTDAGSTKAELVDTIEASLPRGIRYVGSHPLAGSEKQGANHADANLFQDRLAIVTPTAASDPGALEQTSVFWRALGCRVRVMKPQEHDEALALTSHLPHLLAATLAGSLPEPLRELTASGFRDTTRIASGDPDLWTAIFQQNRAHVLEALGLLLKRLDRFRDCLQDRDWKTLNELLAQAKKVRDALGS